MKVTNTRKIIQTQLKTDGTDASEELNARTYNWVKRTAIPTLDEYIIEPFETSLKEITMKMASEKEGLKEGEWLRERYVKEWTFPFVRFEVAAYRHSSISHEAVLGQAQRFLEDCILDNADNVRREFIRKNNGDPHVSAGYILREFGRWRNENTKFYNKQDIQTMGNLPSAVSELVVALDTNRFKTIHEVHAQDYLRAKALKGGLNAFVKDFTEHVRARHGIDVREEELETDYEVSDSSAIRYLFYAKEISASTGDLVLLEDLGFKDAYQKKGRGRIIVSTVRCLGRLGICTLDRLDKG